MRTESDGLRQTCKAFIKPYTVWRAMNKPINYFNQFNFFQIIEFIIAKAIKHQMMLKSVALRQ